MFNDDVDVFSRLAVALAILMFAAAAAWIVDQAIKMRNGD